MDRVGLLEKIQASVDGELTAAEQAELAQVLLLDPEARRLRDELLRTDRLLRGIAASESPPGMRDVILAGTVRSGRPGSAAQTRHRQSTYRIAAAVLAGLVIVGVGYLVRDGRAPGSDLEGSLGAAGGPQPSQSAGDSAWLRGEGVSISASLRREGNTLSLELDSSAMMPCEVIVSIDPAKTAFAGSAGHASVAVSGNLVTARLPAGRQVAVLNFVGTESIRLELRAGGRSLGETRLPVSAP